MGVDIHGNVAYIHNKGDVSPIASDTSSAMSWSIPPEIPSNLPFRPTLATQQSSSLPSTPYQKPRDLPFRPDSPSPNRGNISPRSTHSEFNHILPARKQYGGCRYETGMAHFRRRIPYSLGSELLPEEPGPLKERLEPTEEKKLTGDMRKLYDSLIPSAESESQRSQFVQKLERLLNKQWPGNDIKVRVFGSSGNKLCTSSSDVDICITTPFKKLEGVCIIADFLAKCGMQRVVCVSHAKVPIVKIWDPELQVACDMNVNNTLALENTRMIKTYVEIDERVRPLAMILKHWAKRRILNDAALGGTLSSYTWICLIINFLQTRSPPIVPNLQQRSQYQRRSSDDHAFDDDLENLSTFGNQNKSTLGELLFEFFRYYAHEVDYEKNVISVREGRLISKEGKGWHLLQNNRLCVEEPFNTSRNLGNTADDTSFRGLHQELRRAFKAVSEGKLDECCEQYEYPPEEERSWERPAPQPRPVITPMPSLPSRGGRGGGRGARHSNHYNRGGANAGRRASNSANKSNVPRQVNNGYPAEIAMQDQQAQYLLHDQLYQQYQLLQAQEQELRIQQALMSRANTAVLRQPYLQVPVQQESAPSDENSRSRAGTVNHPPLTSSTRQNTFYNSYVPANVPSIQASNTNPSSPSMSTAIPDLRRNHRRSSVVSGSPRGSLRAQSQPARPLTSPIANSFNVVYPFAGQPESPIVHNVGLPPDSPQRGPTEKGIAVPTTAGPVFSRSTYLDESVPQEYIGYYVGDSPQSQSTYRRPMASSSFPGPSGLALPNGAPPSFYNSPEYQPASMGSREESGSFLEHTDASNSTSQPPSSQKTPRLKTLADQGPLIVDGSLPVSEYRHQPVQDDQHGHLLTPLNSSTPGQGASRNDTPDYTLHDIHHQIPYDEYGSISHRQHQGSHHILQNNGWEPTVRNNNAPTNGNMGRLETLSERLQRFQLSDSSYSTDSAASHYSKANSVRGPERVGSKATNASMQTPTPINVHSPVKDPCIVSPSAKRRVNGSDTGKLNGVNPKVKSKGRQESPTTNPVPSAESKERNPESTRKQNGVHIVNGYGTTDHRMPSNTSSWQTTKKKNKKATKTFTESNHVTAGAEPLPADESLRKGG